MFYLAAFCAGTGWGYALSRGVLDLIDGDRASATLAFIVSTICFIGTIYLVEA